jgi:hypothetical protein
MTLPRNRAEWQWLGLQVGSVAVVIVVLWLLTRGI